VVLTENGVVTDVNAAICEMLGRAGEVLIGRPVVEFIDPDCREFVRQAIVTNREEPYEITAVHRDGSKIPVLVKARTLPLRGRAIRGTTIRDLRLQRQVDEALRHGIAYAMTRPRGAQADSGGGFRRARGPGAGG
jgi:PAS domain S-box-containing protein